MKKHLITGITGQDGIFLVEKILTEEPNSKIIGISRKENLKSFYSNLKSLDLNNFKNLYIYNLDLTNFDDTCYFLKKNSPDYIYNLSGPSSPYESLSFPEKYKLIITIFDNLTKASIKNNLFPNFFQASSSEMFKDSEGQNLNEFSSFEPNSPYSKFKYQNHKKVLELRTNYEWQIISGIMFNHESEFRKENYLFRKIIDSAYKIKKGELNNLTVGSLEYTRDWSFAGDISNAIYAITNNGSHESYVVGSGQGNTIERLIDIVFDFFNLDYKSFVNVDNSILRKGDPKHIVADPSRVMDELMWKPKISFETLIKRCIDLRI